MVNDKATGITLNFHNHLFLADKRRGDDSPKFTKPAGEGVGLKAESVVQMSNRPLYLETSVGFLHSPQVARCLPGSQEPWGQSP